jgi:hypothetical protein
MNARRDFLKGFGLTAGIGAVAVAARQYQYNQIKPELTDEDIKHLAPVSPMLLTLTADNRTAEEKNMNKSKINEPTMVGNYFFDTTKITHQVSMSVGKDNRLWLRIGEKWKRVALDTEV